MVHLHEAFEFELSVQETINLRNSKLLDVISESSQEIFAYSRNLDLMKLWSYYSRS